MNDLDRLLKESLNAVRDSYADERQEERFEMRARFIERYRRRRAIFTTGSFALAGAALIAGVMLFSGNLDVFADRDPKNDVASDLQEGVLTAVTTGDEPVDAGVRPGDIWVANSGDDTLTHIDTESNTVVGPVELDGPPQEVDVGEGSVWVAGFGRVSAFNPNTDEPKGSVEVGAADAEINLSIGEEAVWVVVEGEGLIRIDPVSLEATRIEGANAPVDVAARDGSVWVLDEEAGLLQFDPVSGEQLGKAIPGLTGGGDISGGGGVIWIGDRSGDKVIRLDAATRELKASFEVTGTYLDMAVSDEVVWVLSKPNGHALLTALNIETAKPLGKPLKLDGDPVEVSSSGGAVWVVARELGAILRIDPAAVTAE